MSVHEEWMACGSWDITLKPDTPRSIRHAAVYPFGWLVITPNRLFDSAIDRTTLLANSRFTGMIRSRDQQGTSVSFGGPSIFSLLGDESGKGPSQLDNIQWDLSGETLADAWGTAENPPAQGRYGLFNTSVLNRVNGLTPGTVWDDFTLTTFWSINDTSPQIEDMITRQGIISELAEEELSPPYAFRVNPDGSCDIGESSTGTAGFVRTAPKVLVWEGPSSTEVDGVAVLGASISVHEDADDYATYVRCFYDHAGTSDITTSTSNTSATRSHSYKGFDGTRALLLDIVMDDSASTTLQEARGAAKQTLAEHDLRYEITADCESRPDLHLYARPGDYAWVYAPEAGVDRGFSWNTGVFEVSAGRTINPAKGRIQSIEWPITEGMGVYLCSNTWGAITDVSEYVDFEDGSTRIDLGESIRKQNLQNLVKSSNWKRS